MEKERKAVADKGFDFSVGFQQLQQASATPESRQYYEGKTVQLVGRYLPGANDTTFGLVRYKMNCCAADAIPLSALIMLDPRSSQKLPPDLPGQWVQVRGQVQFWQRRDKPGVFATVVLVQPTPEHSLDDQVKRVRRPDNIYLY
jgi:uncharacterized membrane protein YcgQ (UPF0703/DUF1980 family)